MLDLPRFERDAESYCRALNRERYLYCTGLQATLELTTLYEDYEPLFRTDTYGELQEADTDPEHRQRLLAFAADGFLADRVKSFDERLAVRIAAATIEWDALPLPYNSVKSALANEPDPHRRHDLESRWLQCAAMLNPLHEERQRTRLESALALGSDYPSLVAELHSLAYDDLTTAATAFLSATQELYLGALGEWLGLQGLSLVDATPSDLVRLFRAPDFDLVFNPKALLPALYRSLRDLGMDVRDQSNLSLDWEPRPLKAPGSYCWPLALPDDVRFGLRPIGGCQDYLGLFLAAGTAVHYANVDRTLGFADRWLGDPSVPRSMGRLLESLLLVPAWLERYVEYEQPADFRRLGLLQRLTRVRRAATGILYTQEFYRTDDFDALARRYAELFTLHLGVEHAPEPFLAAIADDLAPMYTFRAWIFAAQHARYLAAQYDEEWYRSPRAAHFLRDLWREGQKHSVDELARFMGYSGLDLRPLVEELNEGLS